MDIGDEKPVLSATDPKKNPPATFASGRRQAPPTAPSPARRKE
jgi:hypothetical protein